MKKLVVVADCVIDPDFINIFERELQTKVEVFYIDTTEKKRNNKISRHLSYFLIAFKVFVFRKKYNYIIFWQQFMGLYYGILSNICPWDRKFPITVVLHLIYKPRKGLVGKVQKIFFFGALNSRSLNRFICHSSQERELYLNLFGQAYSNKTFFIKYGLNLPREIMEMKEKVGDYFFSGGTSNRDYKTLIKAFEGLNQQLIVACFPKDIEGLKIPPNVKIIHNVFGNEFLKYMNNSYTVIITLENPNISSGHLVLLRAMGLKKSVIATAGSCLNDYADMSCCILVTDHSPEQIREAVIQLRNDQEKKIILAQNAFKKYLKEFTLEIYGQRIADVVKNIEVRK